VETSSSKDVQSRLDLIIDGTAEVVGKDLLEAQLKEGSGRLGGPIRAYIGFEPSGKAHIGWLVLADQMRRMLDAELHLTILLADWHAWINDKFGGDLDAIATTSEYMETVFRTLLLNPSEGEGPGEITFIRASELVDNAEYWAQFIHHMKGTSLARIRKAFTIMGRDGDAAEQDAAKYLYPAMQATDIHALGIDVALGGMDQRKAHMYMRDVAERLDLPKATCIHMPMLPGLKSSTGRMDASHFGGKMSKSDPNGAILLHDGRGKLRKKLRGAWLDPAESESPVHEIVKHLVLNQQDRFRVDRAEEHGGPLSISSLDEARELLASEKLHPLDYKQAIADLIATRLQPIHDAFEKSPDQLRAVERLLNR